MASPLALVFAFVAILVLAIVTISAIIVEQRRRRLQYIDDYVWPPGLINRLKAEYPRFSRSDCQLIDQGLRQFFRAYLNGGRRDVAMPSQAVDELWHHFILYTQSYGDFCTRAFGRFLHHTPAVMLSPIGKQSNEGLRRVWWQACREEQIDPRAPASLPLLFAIDARLKVPGGYVYHPDCEALRRAGVLSGQCGGDFGSSSFDGGTAGFGGGSGCSDSSGDGGSGGGGGGCGGGGGD